MCAERSVLSLRLNSYACQPCPRPDGPVPRSQARTVGPRLILFNEMGVPSQGTGHRAASFSQPLGP